MEMVDSVVAVFADHNGAEAAVKLRAGHRGANKTASMVARKDCRLFMKISAICEFPPKHWRNHRAGGMGR
jgi:hypothetical protein